MEPSSSHRGEVRRGLQLLLDHRDADGRYLVTRKVHWQAVYRVLVDEGWYDASLGYAGFVGLVLGIVLCLLQQQFGLVGLGGDGQFVVDAYPVRVKLTDILLVFVSVALVSALSVWLPIRLLNKHFLKNRQ